jgi:hypothetical protein
MPAAGWNLAFYAALSILLIIALLTDWPEILHGNGIRLGPW